MTDYKAAALDARARVARLLFGSDYRASAEAARAAVRTLLSR